MRTWNLFLPAAILLLVVAAGCSGLELPNAATRDAVVTAIVDTLSPEHAVASATPPPAVSATPPATAGAERTHAHVVRVVDGDTIHVAIAGKPYTLRYIGVDTPETVHPEQPVEWMGPEASAANKELVMGETVWLEKDISETDRYGRLLRYVFLEDGTFVNAELVRRGFAQVVTYPPDVKYHDLFLAMQQEAREAGRGLWGAPPDGTGTPAPATAVAVVPTLAPGEALVVVVAVDKRAEYVDIQNTGADAQDLAGWVLESERGRQRCTLGGTIGPGETLRVWALAADAAQPGYNCGFESTIWSNSEPDAAVLYDAQGREVARK